MAIENSVSNDFLSIMIAGSIDDFDCCLPGVCQYSAVSL